MTIEQPKKRLLLVDDEPDMLRMLTMMLAMEGFETTAVGSGEAALAALQRDRYDLVMTDLCMPGMDGYATIKALKALDPSLCVLVSTGFATNETTLRVKAAGAYGMLQKPFSFDELTQLLDEALAACESLDG